ncbi:DUF4179 domain-containing protein [Brevibacillus sp. GCM10020057]|uniref:DUF4179 domain-containing protein n=1 Tax=Brevibacillus sp. GCM10020057 TaxID=3317327 RepID=UPI0036308DC2
MSLEQQIKAAKCCHENHPVDVEDFKKRVFQKLEKHKEWKARPSRVAFLKLASNTESSKRKQTFKKLSVMTTATAASLGVVIGAGMTSPGFAEALKQIPVVQSVFHMVGDDGLKLAHEKGIVSTIQKTATDSDITVTITEVFYDGAQISVGFMVESPDKLSDMHRLTKSIKINGTTPESWGTGGTIHPIDDYKAVGVINFSTSEPLPEKFQFDLSIQKIGDTRGDWSFSFPIVKNDATNQLFTPMVTKTYGDTTLILEKITFTVHSTELVGQIIQSGASHSAMFEVFEVTDDKGKELGLLSSSLGENKVDGEKVTARWKAIYQPVKELPKSITIRPATLEKVDLPAEIIKGLEIIVPIQKNR